MGMKMGHQEEESQLSLLIRLRQQSRTNKDSTSRISSLLTHLEFVGWDGMEWKDSERR